jgi:hypothetical protein
MATVAKVGDALLQGVEGLLGLEDTTYLAGHRLSLTPDPLHPLTAGFTALVGPPTPPAEELLVRDRRLLIGEELDAQPYRGSDFILLSISGGHTKGDESALPFFPLKMDAIAALADGEEGIKRGKAHLITAYQQMRRSHDITEKEADRLFEKWIDEFKKEMARYRRLDSLPVGRRRANNGRAIGSAQEIEAKRLEGKRLNAAVVRLSL